MTYLIVTSRCPCSHDRSHGREVTRDNAGGVASALKLLMEREGGIWVCWGDGRLDQDYTEEDMGNYRIVRVNLTRREKKGFYDEYANGILWPLFHYFRERISFTGDSFRYYRQVNEKFADRILEYIEDGMKIWIHDYQLTLLPGMLRKKGVDNFTLFTWHIPWVASEFFSILPEAEEIIGSISRTDMITFHTPLYRENFRASGKKVLNNSFNYDGKLYSFSLGIDDSYYRNSGASKVRVRSLEGRKMIFSIDRLDYTKGLINRVLAIENMLERFPEYSGKFQYVMVVTPSRTSVSEYQELKKELEMTIGRINGEYGNISWAPIIYMYRRISDRTLISYYANADIAIITPLMDGLNLVSKEFVSVTDSGILIISQFAGAAYDLEEGAIVVNPYNIQEIADALLYSLNMNEDEKQRRLEAMKENVHGRNLSWWIGEIKDTAGKLSGEKEESSYAR